MPHRRIIALIALCAALPVHAGRPKADRLPPSTKLSLPNGMEVILIPNRSAPLITSVVVVRAGLAHETPEINGVSHMLEHLLFNGTQRRTQEAIYDEQDRYGIINNATTGPAHTAYFVMATRAQFHRALDLQADMLFGSTIPPDKLEKERGIIANEIAKDQAGGSAALDELYEAGMHRGTPLAMPVIGTAETIQAISREAILAYYRARYVPNNMTAIVMGDFEVEEIEPLVRRCFGTVPPGLIGVTPVWEPDPNAGGASWSKRSAGPARMVALGAGAPGPASELLGPVWMLASLLGEDLAGPVNARLAASGAAGRVVSAQAAYEMRGAAATLRAEATMDDKLSCTEAIGALGAELQERARTASSSGKSWKGDTLARLRLEEKASLMRLWEKPHYFGLDRAPFIAAAGWEKARDLPRALEFVEPGDLRDVGRRYGAASAWASFCAAPEVAEVLPTAQGPPPSLSLPAAGRPASTSESRGAVSAWKGEAKEAAAQSAVEPAALPARAGATTDVTNARLILNNGLLVNIDFTNDSRVFAAHVLVKHRAAAEPPERAGIADLLHRVAGAGTRRHPGAALEQALRAIGGTLKVTDEASIPFDDIYLSPEYSYIRLEALDEHYEEALELLAGILAEPDLGAAEALETARGQLAARARQSAASPSEQARLELARGLWGEGHPFARGVFGTEATVAAITQDDLIAFHRSYFHPRNIILAVGTSVTPEQILPALHAKLGHWSTNGRPPRPAGAPGAASGDFSVRRSSVTSTQAYLALGRLAPPDRGTDSAWTAMAAVLSRRMGDVLREQRGLSYSLGADAALLGGQRQFTATMGTLPAKVAEAESGMREVLLSLASRPADQTEIDDARRATEVRLLMRGLSRINRAWSRCLSELRGTAQPQSRVAPEAGPQEVGDLARTMLGDEKLSGWVEAIAAAPAVAADHP